VAGVERQRNAPGAKQRCQIKSALGVDILAQTVIDGRLMFGMPAFERTIPGQRHQATG